MSSIIWQPTLKPSTYSTTKPRIRPPVNANRVKAQGETQEYSIENRPNIEIAGRNYDPTNTNDEADDDSPSIAEIMSDYSRPQPGSADSADKNQGTRGMSDPIKEGSSLLTIRRQAGAT